MSSTENEYESLQLTNKKVFNFFFFRVVFWEIRKSLTENEHDTHTSKE